uniref:Uncharacterized protein LOC105851516 isoform X1 n=1 Tax=Cicer arietinum TaxID=3827 RepID=A0A3Q7YG77_CICAR|nr:uncharacterized protein LOC105851516 isoform X1 [Cicer arietinum]XP_027191762.1 uncharacterized protein LOC105851516 isoform X1 [Cicer arietinum]
MEAIGRPKHFGCVKAIGGGVVIQQYFGPNSRPSSTSPIMSNQIETIKAKLTKVQNANAQVPKPIDEVTAVGQAPYNFIQWPKRLLQLVSNKAIEVSKKDDIPSKRLNFQLNYVEQLMVMTMNISKPLEFKLEYGGTSLFFLPLKEFIDLCMAKEHICITILQVLLRKLCFICKFCQIMNFIYYKN